MGRHERETPRTPEALVLYEQYEADGNLLLVTSDVTLLDLAPSDSLVRRMWSTGNEPEPLPASPEGGEQRG